MVLFNVNNELSFIKSEWLDRHIGLYQVCILFLTASHINPLRAAHKSGRLNSFDDRIDSTTLGKLFHMRSISFNDEDNIKITISLDDHHTSGDYPNMEEIIATGMCCEASDN